MMRLLLLFCLAVAGATNAATIDPRIAKADTCGRYEVFHINGVNVLPADAAANLDRLRTVYGNAYNGHLLRYALAYNESRGALIDLMDAYQQVVRSYSGVTFDEWLDAVILGVFTESMTREVMTAIAQGVARLFDQDRPSAYYSQDLTAIVAAIRAQTTTNSRRLLVPHSQGNLYANLVFDQLTAAGPQQMHPDTIGILAIATPASRVRGGGRYVTSRNDLVINGARFVFRDVLIGNVTAAITSRDLRGHSMIGVYLTDATVRPRVVGDMTFELAQLKSQSPPTFPEPTMGSHSQRFMCPGYTECLPPPALQSVVVYYVAGAGGGIRTAPSATAAQGFQWATAHAMACYRLAVDAEIRMRTGQPYTAPQNCGGTQFSGAWYLYATDGIEARIIEPAYEWGLLRIGLHGVCQRAGTT